MLPQLNDSDCQNVNRETVNSPGGFSNNSDDNNSDGSESFLVEGRHETNIEFAKDDRARHVIFSERKANIMKKIINAYELSTLTGTQALLLVLSESGLIYTFSTPKLQPIVTETEGKDLIQRCLKVPDDNSKLKVSDPAPNSDSIHENNGNDSAPKYSPSKEKQNQEQPLPVANNNLIIVLSVIIAILLQIFYMLNQIMGH